jgi:hypothetical protein
MRFRIDSSTLGLILNHIQIVLYMCFPEWWLLVIFWDIIQCNDAALEGLVQRYNKPGV